MEKSFEKIMAKRCAVCYFLVCLFFVYSFLRVYSSAVDATVSAQNSFGRYSLTMGRKRGAIYDFNGVKLNRNDERIIAAVSPSGEAVMALRGVLAGDPSLTGIIERLENGKPIICELPRIIECEGIKCVVMEYDDISCKTALHTLGYTDNGNRGVSGLERAFDDILYCEETVDASFEVNALGEVIGNGNIIISGENVNPYGLVTTIDSEIQRITEYCARNIECGAVVVCEVGTGRIKASVSKPDFKGLNVSEILDDKNSPLLNRALEAYSVGSVFKPCVAAAGIEKGMGNYEYNCLGHSEIEGRLFHCHNRSGHGNLNLSGAIENSCNTYFYTFSSLFGADAILEKCSVLNFGTGFEIAKNYSVKAGNLPKADGVKTVSALANLAIGQGEVLLSPVSILTLYCAIANDGKYYLPYIAEEVIVEGERQRLSTPKVTSVMEKSTADRLKQDLIGVVERGTGTAAKPTLCTAAGKTATAQTGRYDESGKEITIGWFCGFFPAENPQYAVSVMIEGANGYDAAPVFASLADGITNMKSGLPYSLGK